MNGKIIFISILFATVLVITLLVIVVKDDEWIGKEVCFPYFIRKINF